MNPSTFRFGDSPIAALSPAPDHVAVDHAEPERGIDFERAVDHVLDDCFFSVGQAVGTRKTLDYETVVWWRDHYRAKFLRAMRTFGNRWLQDRDNVTSVAFMLAERASRYAGDSASIDVNAAQKAAADVERYCALHSRRVARARGILKADGSAPIIAGYWCPDIP